MTILFYIYYICSERILKIGQHLANLWTILWWLVIFDSQCRNDSSDGNIVEVCTFCASFISGVL